MGIGLYAHGLTFAVAGAGHAAPVSENPDVWLAPDSAGLLFAVVFGAGLLTQLAGLRQKRRALLLLGAAAVFCAAVLDRDPVLATGQIAVAVLLTGRCATTEQGKNPSDAGAGTVRKHR